MLDHPNIINMKEAFIHGDHIILIIEYAAGGELKKFVRERGGCTEDEAQMIMS
jgi:serine/threonine protein kinase